MKTGDRTLFVAVLYRRCIPEGHDGALTKSKIMPTAWTRSETSAWKV
ncbi:MAG TPA: hypothetical protein PLZ86_04140 [bacterium]|nr:hypothetical protein [bacterium]